MATWMICDACGWCGSSRNTPDHVNCMGLGGVPRDPTPREAMLIDASEQARLDAAREALARKAGGG